MPTSVLEELVTVLGFEIDDDDLKSFNKLTDAAVKTMKRVAVAGGVAAAGLGVFINSVTAATDEAFKFSQTLDVSFQRMQRLIFASKTLGGSAAGVMATLSSINRLAISAARGEGGGEVFGFFGLDPTKGGKVKNPLDLLSEMADKLRSLGTAAEQVEFAKKFGLDERMILLLRKGSAGIAALGADLDRLGFVISDEQAEQASEFVKSMIRAREVVKGFGDVIGLRFAPRVDAMVKSFVEWRKANDGLVTENLEKFLTTLEKLAGPAKVIGGIIAAMLVGAQLANIAIGILVAAFAALVADVIGFIDGKDSLLGRAVTLVEKVIPLRAPFPKPEIGATLRALGDPATFRQGGATTTNSVKVEANININGAGNPGETGLRVREAIEEMNRNALAGVAVATGT